MDLRGLVVSTPDCAALSSMRRVALAISLTHIPPNAVQSEAAKHAAHDYK